MAKDAFYLHYDEIERSVHIGQPKIAFLVIDGKQSNLPEHLRMSSRVFSRSCVDFQLIPDLRIIGH